MEDLEGKENKAHDECDWTFFWVWGRKGKLKDHVRYKGGGGGGLGSQVEVYSMHDWYLHVHSQVTLLHPSTPQSLFCKQSENKFRGMMHNNATHSGHGHTLAMEGHCEEEEEDFRDSSK